MNIHDIHSSRKAGSKNQRLLISESRSNVDQGIEFARLANCVLFVGIHYTLESNEWRAIWLASLYHCYVLSAETNAGTCNSVTPAYWVERLCSDWAAWLHGLCGAVWRYERNWCDIRSTVDSATTMLLIYAISAQENGGVRGAWRETSVDEFPMATAKK